jgi:cytochrome c oxidase subunit II
MSTLLIILIVALVFLVIVQVSKVIELVGVIKKEDVDAYERKNDRLTYLLVLTGFATIVYCIVSLILRKDMFLPVSASEHGVWIDSLIKVTFFFTGIVFLITQVLLFAFVFKYRFNRNRKAVYLPENHNVELVWTVVPAIVLFILVGMGLDKWFKIFKPVPTEAIVIEATAQQFRWTIRYPGEDNVLGPRDFTLVNSENELGVNWNDETSHDDFIAQDIVLPVNQPVLVKIGSLDVLHNFYLPHFRLKMDAVPGIPTKFWFRPTITTDSMRIIVNNPNFEYELACAELCGSAHYNMRKVVKIVSDKEYADWKSKQVSYYETVIKPLQASN